MIAFNGMDTVDESPLIKVNKKIQNYSHANSELVSEDQAHSLAQAANQGYDSLPVDSLDQVQQKDKY